MSKRIGRQVIAIILSDDEDKCDKLFDCISNVLVEIKTTPLQDFVITKELSKSIEKYGKDQSQPHVHVAIRMRDHFQKSPKPGDYIEYVITAGAGSLAERARSPLETIVVDQEWYIANQIFPPISRLCDGILGMDVDQIASWLDIKTTITKPKVPMFERLTRSLDGVFDVKPFQPKCKCGMAAKIGTVCSKCKLPVPQKTLENDVRASIIKMRRSMIEAEWKCVECFLIGEPVLRLGSPTCLVCGAKMERSVDSLDCHIHLVYLRSLFRNDQPILDIITSQMRSNVYSTVSFKSIFLC